jgi:hypothetical protein
MFKKKVNTTYNILSSPWSDLDVAISYIKSHKEDYSGEWLNIDNPKIETEIRQDLTDIWKKPLYRLIALDSKEDLDTTSLGIYWTYNKDRAKAYWGEGKVRLLLTAKVKENDIDWLATVEQHLKIKYSGEDEVRLLEKAKPKVVKIEFPS